MKLYNVLLLFCCAVILTSCITNPDNHPVYDSFVCSINADGSGFQKLISISQLPFETSQLWDLYVTKDRKLIFAADKYYITEGDSINPIPFINITSDSYGLTLANDGKIYYCQNGDLYRYDFVTQTPNNLTENIDGFLTNPFISPDDSIITLLDLSQDSTNTSTLCYFRLSDNSMHFLPEAGDNTRRGIYSPLTNKLYHEQIDGLYKIDLDGNHNTLLLSYHSLTLQLFGLNSFSNLVVIDDHAIFRIFNISDEQVVFDQHLSDITIIPKIAKYANKVFFVNNKELYLYDLDNQISVEVPNTSGLEVVMCPTWDGSKIYFIAYLRVD